MHHLREIEIDSLLEHIEEHFPDALDLLSESCFIYGGAIRDILAKSAIFGDLDIAVPSNDLPKVVEMFLNSPRWIKGDDFIEIAKSNNNYPGSVMSNFVSSIRSFVNSDNKVVQFMEIIPDNSKCGKEVVLENTLKLVQNVDIVCCGVISDIYGTAYEVLPGAVDDCKNRILRFNEDLRMNEASLKKLEERIEKLVNRGWDNKISIEDVRKMIEK